MTAEMSITLFVGLAATVEDLLRRRVSNWIPAVALAAGLMCLSAQRGWRGALSSFAGAIGGFCVFFIFYWLGGMGGGDVKLMAGFGAVLGIERLVEASLWAAACGGVIAALWIGATALRNVVSHTGRQSRTDAIPYAPALALGACLALVPKV